MKIRVSRYELKQCEYVIDVDTETLESLGAENSGDELEHEIDQIISDLIAEQCARPNDEWDAETEAVYNWSKEQ